MITERYDVIGPRGLIAAFAAREVCEALAFARDCSRHIGVGVEVIYRHSRHGGIVGQYHCGKVSREFVAHDRSAGLRSKIQESV